jgi:hypothetical protein
MEDEMRYLVGLGQKALVLAAVLVGAAVFASPATSAAPKSLDPPPIPGAWRVSPVGGFQPLQSMKLDLRPTGLKRIARGSWWGGPIVANTGEGVLLYESDRFAPDEGTRQLWANFFAGLYHGLEFPTLRIYQATLDEVRALCGSPQAGGCYSPSARILVFPGDLDPGTEADIGAHEYGHHVAANRDNAPWAAIDWGTKRWATYVGVCARVAAGTAFPGDEADHYVLNPGEAFAEAFRVLNTQRGGTWANLPLVADGSFAPDSGSLAAVLADVQQPWAAQAATWDGRFGSPPVLTKLGARVGPGARISLTTARGAPVRSLRSGVYAITVSDVSAKDNFHLTGGAAVNRRTGVSGKGTLVWKLALKAGVYRYRSDAHLELGGSFTVTDSALPTGASSYPPQDRPIPTLLDGEFRASVTGTANARLELIDAATGQNLVAAAPGAISYTICGQRSVLLRVVADQPGTFQISLATP